MNLFAVMVMFACILYLWSLLDWIKGKFQKRPPGPLRLPILGNLLQMLPVVIDFRKYGLNKLLETQYKPAYIIMDSISKKYGPLASLKFGINSTVLVSSAEYAKIVCCREEFSARFGDGWFIERSFGKTLGLIFNNGENYRELKKFATKALKNFGFGKSKPMEQAIKDELMDFIHDFETKIQSSLNSTLRMEHTFTLPVLNVLWNMIGGTRFCYNDKKLIKLVQVVEEISRSFDIGGNILMAFPELRKVAPRLTGHEQQMQLYHSLHEYFREILDERTKHNSSSGIPRDFVDIFIGEMEKRPELYTEEQFIMICLDLFIAGSETTANTLDFAIMFMVLYPNVQLKVQNEIEQVIGNTRLPEMSDRLSMPYTEATLLEVQRQCNVIPLVHRVCTTNTKLGPYNVKKNDVILINLHSVHSDPNVWGDPETFRPERFLDSDGNLMNHPSLLPFGMGKRVCMGEFLAKLTLFTYFTSLLQRFSFHVSTTYGKPLQKHGKGFTLSPDPFYAHVKLRM